MATNSKIEDGLLPLAVDIGICYPDPENLNLHTERGMKLARFSLKRFGQVKPIVGEKTKRNGKIKIIAGSQLLLAALEEKWEKIAVVVVTDLSESLLRQFAIVDNRAAQLSYFNSAELYKLLMHIEAHVDLGSLGWMERDIQALEKRLQMAKQKMADSGKKNTGLVSRMLVLNQSTVVKYDGLRRMLWLEGIKSDDNFLEFVLWAEKHQYDN